MTNKDTKYVLTLTPEQIAVVQRACEFYFRIRIGQLQELDDELTFIGAIYDDVKKHDYKRLDEFREKVEELKQIAFPSGQLGLEDNASNHAWNIYQVTRYVRSWHEHPEGGYTVNFDKPMDLYGVGLPECYVKEG